MIQATGHDNKTSYLLQEDKSREAFKFVARNVRIRTDRNNDTYPIIVFIHKESKIPAAYPGFERYAIDFRSESRKKGRTLYKKANSVCLLLNYMLWKTSVNTIHELTLNDIRGFLVYMKTEHNGYDDPEEFLRLRACVFEFLCRYYDENHNNFEFRYSSSDLKEEHLVRDALSGASHMFTEYKDLNIKKPHKRRRKKNRVLFYEAKDMLIYIARKYDPMLALPIAFQCYSGIREGEVVNITCGGVNIIRGSNKAVRDIELYLEDEMETFKNWDRKTDPGSIKTHVNAKIYPKFIYETLNLYDEHMALLGIMGADISEGAPMFLNTWGKPMTEFTYRERVKKLFYNRFLPLLIAQCEREGTLAENLAYIETYEKEYPGAHMFRHWFTNYLFIYEGLSKTEIMHLRRDSSQLSQGDYLEVTDDIRRQYTESVINFQKSIFDQIMGEELRII